MRYSIDTSAFGSYDEGGSAEFYCIKENKNIGFKQFKNKRSASSAYHKQKLLSKYDLAPKIIGHICQLPILYNNFIDYTNWGFITEKAKLVSESVMKKRMNEIQKLVETIHKKTGLKFWDCHYWNVGYIKRLDKTKLVCIDTGPESFHRDSNAWGFGFPGPKCNYCNRYQCSC